MIEVLTSELASSVADILENKSSLSSEDQLNDLHHLIARIASIPNKPGAGCSMRPNEAIALLRRIEEGEFSGIDWYPLFLTLLDQYSQKAIQQ